MPQEFKIKNGVIVDQGGANITGSSFISGALAINSSGSSVFTVDGTAGRLFSVDDSLSGSLFSVNTAAGLPVIEAFSDNTIRVGQYGKQALFVSQSKVGIGKENALNGILDVSGSVTVTGSVTATNFTGSLFGSASYALTASFALNAGGASIDTGSFATTGSNVFRGNQTVTGSLTLSSSAEVELTVIGNQVNTGSITATQGFTGSLFGTASWANNASTASYASNGGVTQLLAGSNITLSPTNGLGQVTINSTGGGGSSFNTATGSYGSFYSTQTQTNVAGTARSMSLNITDISNGVSVSGSTDPFNTYIKTENAGVYNIQFSAQVDKTDSGTDEIWIWVRKNGTNLTDTATSVQLDGNGAHYVAAWNFFVNAAANDYFQLMWYSPDANVRLHAEPAFGVVPGIPSLIVTANRIDQFLSNTGSFSGSFNGSLFGTASWANNATTASYILQAVSASFAATASSADNFTVRGTLTAQTIVAQTITSSTDFITGSTRFGSLSTNTHQFTGSVSITGSTTITGGNLTLEGTSLLNWNGSEGLYLDRTQIYRNYYGNVFGRIQFNGGITAYNGITVGLILSAFNNDNNAIYILRNPESNANNIYIGNNTAGNATLSASFHVDTPGKGILLPRMGTTQYTNMSAPPQGILLYNTGSLVEGFYYYSSGSVKAWTRLLNDTGSQTISGSLLATQGFTGSLFGTSSWATNAVTASYISASNIAGLSLSQISLGAVTASITAGSNIFNIISGSNTLVVVDNTGSVGIGTTSPGYKLDVIGTARISGSVSLAAGLNTKTFSQDDTNVSLYLWTRSGFGTYSGTNAGFYHHFSNGNTFSLSNNTDNIYIGGGSTPFTANVISSVGLLATGVSQNYGVAIGSISSVENYAGVAIGRGAKTTGGTTNYGGVAIGFSALANNYSFAFGYTVADDGEFVAASAISFNQLKPITNVYFGSGKILGDPGGTVRNGAGASYTINGSGANGTDFAGGNITIAGGKGTGAGTSGDVIISTATPTTTGTTLQTLSNRVWIKGQTGNVGIGASPNAAYKLDVSGSFRSTANSEITGSLSVTQGITGSLFGTSSWAQNAVTASYILQAVSASFASTASFAPLYVLNSQTSSFVQNAQTSSFVTNAQTSSFVLNSQTSSMTVLSASYASGSTSASFASTAASAPLYVLTSATASMLTPYLLVSQTSSFVTTAQTSSFVTNAQTSSFVQNSQTSSMSVATASFATSSLSASFASTASFAPLYVLNSQTSSFVQNNQTSSFVLNSQTSSMTVATASFATSSLSASFASTASSADNFTVRGTLTAQTIVVQTITSSTDFVTGSSRFGSIITNTHQFTGSVSISGSLTVSSGVINNLTASNAVTASYWSGSILNATSASFASTASYWSGSVLNATSASFASTASYISASNIAGLSLSQISLGLVTASITAGSNIFNIVSGSNTLVVVDNTGSVGIGTTSPSAKLEVQGNIKLGADNSGNYIQHTHNPPGGVIIRLSRSDNTGVGTMTNYDGFGTFGFGNITVTNNVSGSSGKFNTLNIGVSGSDTSAAITAYGRHQLIQNWGTNDPTLWIRQTVAGGAVDQSTGLLVDVQGQLSHYIAHFRDNNSGTPITRFVVRRSGNVGIGTSNPTSASLQVNGNIWADSFTGSLQGTSSWAQNAVTSSYILQAVSASFATSASFAVSASWAPGGSSTPTFPYTGSAIITGSLVVTGSTTSTLGFTGSLFGTSSFSTTSSFTLNIDGGTY